MSKMKRKKSQAAPGAPASSSGSASRRAILEAAARLATTHGLEGLSIGDLASHMGMSKSGLYAHFKSKEELQLATIDAALEICGREIMAHVMSVPAGKRRLLALTSGHLSHLRRRVFPGGCFFCTVSAEMASRPGRVHDRMEQLMHQWLGLIEQIVRDAQDNGEVERRADVAQIAFEVQAMLQTANVLFAMSGDASRLDQAQQSIENILARWAPLQPARSKLAGKRQKVDVG
jgi:AcrR family transcriptional regulator